jgi:polar amino acid transport system substrate-binding protein
MIGVHDFEPIEAEFAELLPGLSDGRWRMTTGLFGTDERRKIAAFSRPIWALPDGLLVPDGNPKALSGYRSAAQMPECRLAVIRDQFQHRSAIEFGVPKDRILIYETYTDAANAVLDGRADAYASVARAHTGFIERNNRPALEVVSVGAEEKEPAFGSFAFGRSENDLRRAIDGALLQHLGSSEHRKMMKSFGFTDDEVDLVAG